MEPFIATLQHQIYTEHTLKVEAVAEEIGISRVTLWGWANQRWCIPLYGARKLAARSPDLRLARALVSGTGLRLAPTMAPKPQQSLFVLIGNHMEMYDKLVRIAVKIKQATATEEDRAEARQLLDRFRDFTDELEAQIDAPETAPKDPTQYRRRATDKE